LGLATKADLDRIEGPDENSRIVVVAPFAASAAGGADSDQVHPSAHEIGCKCGQSIIAFCQARLNHDVPTATQPVSLNPWLNDDPLGGNDRRRAAEIRSPDADRRRRQRQAAAECRDEVAAFHSITSSARASSDCGTSRPSASLSWG
jgi:hypothetical protein